MPTVLSLDKSLSVLEAIFEHRNGIGTRALASQLKLNVATVHNIARTFCQRGYLRQNPVTKTWHPGLRLMLLGRHPAYTNTLSSLVANIIKSLATQLNENVLLGIINNGHVLNAMYVPCEQALRVHEDENMNHRAYATASGKILLTTLTEPELENYLSQVPLEQLTPRTFSTPEKLRKELKKTREQGYAQTCDEYIEGISAMAVPISDSWGQVIATVATSAPTVRLSNDQIPITLEKLRKAAVSIQKLWAIKS